LSVVEVTLVAQAIDEFGSNLHQAMNVPWERASAIKKNKQRVRDPAIQKWERYEDNEDDESPTHSRWPSVATAQAAAHYLGFCWS
jgi:hypothetical protein